MTCLRRSSLLSLLFLWVSLSDVQVTFTTIDVPGAGVTGVEGINTAGDMVGYYGVGGGGPTHAFLLRGGGGGVAGASNDGGNGKG